MHCRREDSGFEEGGGAGCSWCRQSCTPCPAAGVSLASWSGVQGAVGQVAARLQLYTAAALIQEPTHFSSSPAFVSSLLPAVVSVGLQVRQLCFGMFVNRICGFKLGQSAQCIVKQCSQQYNVRKADGLFIKNVFP